MVIRKIDPVGRMEGHMGVVFDSMVVAPAPWVQPMEKLTPGTVDVEGTMYRGFENIMVDRQPQEGIQICQRI